MISTDYRHQRNSNPEMLGQQACETLNTVLYSVSKWDGWMVGLYAILRPFQQHFSHIRTMGQMTMREFLQWNPVSCGAGTRNRKISRPAHNPLSYRGSLSYWYSFAAANQTNLSGSLTVIVQIFLMYYSSQFSRSV